MKYPQMVFDMESFKNDFIKEVDQRINQIAQQKLAEIRTGQHFSSTEIYTQTLQEGVVKDYIKFVVPDIRAFITEYGKGSAMDKDNPNLDDYVNSGVFNKERLNQGMGILSREKDYEDYAWESGTRDSVTRKGTNNPGINLEDRGGIYSPQAPQHHLTKQFNDFIEQIEIEVKRDLIPLYYQRAKYYWKVEYKETS